MARQFVDLRTSDELPNTSPKMSFELRQRRARHRTCSDGYRAECGRSSSNVRVRGDHLEIEHRGAVVAYRGRKLQGPMAEVLQSEEMPPQGDARAPEVARGVRRAQC